VTGAPERNGGAITCKLCAIAENLFDFEQILSEIEQLLSDFEQILSQIEQLLSDFACVACDFA
jgi:hypothetical protein